MLLDLLLHVTDCTCNLGKVTSETSQNTRGIVEKPFLSVTLQFIRGGLNPLAALVVELGLKRFAAPATSAAEFVNAGMPGQKTKLDALHLDSAGR